MSEKLVIKNKKGTYVVSVEEIVYMEKDLRKIRLHTKRKQLEFYGRFGDVLRLLDERFLYCHRSYVINMDRIQSIAEKQIRVHDDVTLTFGRDSYYRAKKIYDAYTDKKYGSNRC